MIVPNNDHDTRPPRSHDNYCVYGIFHTRRPYDIIIIIIIYSPDDGGGGGHDNPDPRTVGGHCGRASLSRRPRRRREYTSYLIGYRCCCVSRASRCDDAPGAAKNRKSGSAARKMNALGRVDDVRHRCYSPVSTRVHDH